MTSSVDPIQDEIDRLRREVSAVRERIAATEAAIRSRRVVRSFERLLAFEAADAG